MEELVKVNSNPEFQAFMTYEEDQEKILNSRIKEGMKKGIEKGIQQGIKQGIKQGIEQGFEKGKKEGIIEVVKNFKEMGISIDDIKKATGLSMEEIEKL